MLWITLPQDCEQITSRVCSGLYDRLTLVLVDRPTGAEETTRGPGVQGESGNAPWIHS
ncbi:hypothetical protein PILCRDRAFT_816021 [Piloderma croceum F 1598]|uniref:Uncharacterized protein n=1 Tax=Piloderma croceum (strain F 1598) TaxID=765440 RepID=A0A0C3BK74_PILCF|nr:hypothetical protein PILCRDRAFT_816021 [Piloderma croceum F 1598]